MDKSRYIDFFIHFFFSVKIAPLKYDVTLSIPLRLINMASIYANYKISYIRYFKKIYVENIFSPFTFGTKFCVV